MSSAAEFRIYRPSPVLSRFVHCYYSLRGGAAHAPQTIFPDGRMDVVIQLGDPFLRIHADGRMEPQTRALLVGQMRGYVKIAPMGRVHSFGIRFRPGGSEALLRLPAGETTDQIQPLNDISPRLATTLRERLEQAPDPIAAVESLLAAHFSRVREQPVVDCALDEIVRSAGRLPVRELARSAGVSTRHLERVFNARVGIGPKSFARIVRFQRVLRSPSGDWAGLAADCGYTDQAHLIRDFREFTGQTPAEWRARQVAFLQDPGSELG